MFKYKPLRKGWFCFGMVYVIILLTNLFLLHIIILQRNLQNKHASQCAAKKHCLFKYASQCAAKKHCLFKHASQCAAKKHCQRVLVFAKALDY